MVFKLRPAFLEGRPGQVLKNFGTVLFFGLCTIDFGKHEPVQMNSVPLPQVLNIFPPEILRFVETSLATEIAHLQEET